MSAQEIEKVIENVAFSMEVEGFLISDEQKELWGKILRGEKDSAVVLASYIAEAKQIGMVN